LHHISNRYHLHIIICNNNTTLHIYNIILHRLSITRHNHNTTQCSITRYLNTTHHREIEVDIEVEDEEEDLEEAEVQYYVITTKNQDIM
jgi:hypothetical protein